MILKRAGAPPWESISVRIGEPIATPNLLVGKAPAKLRGGAPRACVCNDGDLDLGGYNRRSEDGNPLKASGGGKNPRLPSVQGYRASNNTPRVVFSRAPERQKYETKREPPRLGAKRNFSIVHCF